MLYPLINPLKTFLISGGRDIPPPPGLVLGDGWSRTGKNEYTWDKAGTTVQFAALEFGPISAGVEYKVGGEMTVLNGTGRIVVRLGYNTTPDLLSLTAVGPFSAVGVAGAENTQLRFINDDNVLNTQVVLRNLSITALTAGIAFPELTLTAGQIGTNPRVGFVLGQYGSVSPDQTTLGDPITALFCNNNNGRVRFKVQGEYQPDAFTSMEIVGQGTLLAADALYDYDGFETEYRWDSTGFNLVDTTVYAIDFE